MVKINSNTFFLFMSLYHRKNTVPSPLLKMYVLFQHSICIYAIPWTMITKLNSISVSSFSRKIIHSSLHSFSKRMSSKHFRHCARWLPWSLFSRSLDYWRNANGQFTESSMNEVSSFRNQFPFSYIYNDQHVCHLIPFMLTIKLDGLKVNQAALTGPSPRSFGG